MGAMNLGVMTYDGDGEGGSEKREKLREGGKGNRKENWSLAPRSGPCSFCFNSLNMLPGKVLKWH